MNGLLGRLARLVTRRPWAVLVGIVLVTLALGAMASQQQTVENSEAASGPAVEAQQRIEELFGASASPVQVVVSSPGTDVRNPDAWDAVGAVTAAVEEAVPTERLQGPAGSPAILSFLTPARQAAQRQGIEDPDAATIRELQMAALEALPEEQVAQFTQLLAQGAGAEQAPESGLMLIYLEGSGLTEQERLDLETQVAEAIRSVEPPDGITIRPFSFGILLNNDITSDVLRLFGIAFGLIALMLGLIYWTSPAEGQGGRITRRAVADVALTLGAVVIAIVWMQGIGVLLGPDYLDLIGYFAPQTQVVPVLIVGLGVDYAIHFNERYRDELGDDREPADGFREAMASVGLALVLASLTTAVGFLTNVVTPFGALATLGVLAAVGILAALVVTLTFVPATRFLLDRRADRAGRLPRQSFEGGAGGRLSRLSGATSVVAERAPAAAIAVAVLLAAAGGWGFTRLETEFSLTDFVPEGSPLLDTYQVLRDDFSGAIERGTDVLLEGPVATPEAHDALVRALDDAADIEGVSSIGGRADADSVLSALPATVEADAAVQEAAAAAGLGDDLLVDPDADVEALYGALVEAGGPAVDRVLVEDDGGFTSRVRLRTTVPEGEGERIDAALDDAFQPVEAAGVEITPTSDAIVQAQVSQAIQDSQLLSMVLAVVAATLLLTLYFAVSARRPVLGVITVLPVVLVLLWTFGAMAVLGIPLTPVTATIAALSIGIGVDFAIHVVNRFLEATEAEEDAVSSLRITLTSTGGALLGSGLTTLVGFGVLLTSSLVPFQQLGAVTVLAVGFSLLAAILVLPSVLRVIHRESH